MTSSEVLARARGCVLGLMVGDALGAAVEGFPTDEIRKLCEETWGSRFVKDFILAVHMGTFVADKEPGTYRPATAARDVNFVPTGPPTNEIVARQCARLGMYTDDTNSCLAVAASIVSIGRVDAAHIARSVAEFFQTNEAYRGCPPTAKRVQQAILDGVSEEVSGLPPYFPFQSGSFANGGAMRISPLAIAFRDADSQALRLAVEKAVRFSHRHPEAVDFAVVQAAAVQYALNTAPRDFDAGTLLADLASRCESEGMREAIKATAAALRDAADAVDVDECAAVGHVVDAVTLRREGSGMGFQIASVHMAPCVLWAACRHHGDPCRAVQTAIDFGGDTDTTASMVGAIVGALYGEEWCSPWIDRLENGPCGRDYALGLAEKLASLSLLE